jgi:hypothetical protein
MAAVFVSVMALVMSEIPVFGWIRKVGEKPGKSGIGLA